MNLIYWFRRDLRLQDNIALSAAARCGAVLPVYLLDETRTNDWPLGAASRTWLHHSLAALDQALQSHQNRLILCRGETIQTLLTLVATTNATAIYANALPFPDEIEFDRHVKAALAEQGVSLELFDDDWGAALYGLRTQSGGTFRVFTAFWKSFSQQKVNPPLPAPCNLRAFQNLPQSLSLEQLNLLPTIPWHQNFWTVFEAGEQGAWARWEQFAPTGLQNYARQRNFPAVEGVSRLSPHLHFGEITPRQLWYAIEKQVNNPLCHEGTEAFLRELGWRAFAQYILFHHSDTPNEPLDKRFNHYPWGENLHLLTAWQRGETGIPLVDAGMRQLWQEGWMHNRVRMITASFLVKNGRLRWQLGARWFWDCLLDANLASNTLGWQWVTGCGTDAAPYFRVFNPVKQAEDYDPDGLYIARYLPELADLPPKWRRQPFAAPFKELQNAGVRLDQNYPRPILDLGTSRQAALAGFATIKKSLKLDL